MRCAVLIPTKGRPHLLSRALHTFAVAAKVAGMTITSIVVADDSENPKETLSALDATKSLLPNLTVEHLPRSFAEGPAPGNARTRGLNYLANSAGEHDAVIMFDDDISFTDCRYQGASIASAGSQLLHWIVRHGRSGQIVGCGYVGRQDLALIDHLMLLAERDAEAPADASETRGEVPSEAPGDISGAFLFVPAPAIELPHFLPWYNEDYFWLRRMQRDGWLLKRSVYCLAHAPDDGLYISEDGLWFEQYGEALWRASIESSATVSDAEAKWRAAVSLKDRACEIKTARFAIAKRADMETHNYLAPLLAVENRIDALVVELCHGGCPIFVDDLRKVLFYCCPKVSAPPSVK